MIFGLVYNRIIEIHLDNLELVSMHLHVGNDSFLRNSLFFLLLFSSILNAFLLLFKPVKISCSFFFVDMKWINICYLKNSVSNCLE